MMPDNQIMRRVYLEFFPDFTFKSVDNGIETIGTWCYNVENKNIELTLKEDNNLRIFLLDHKKFQTALKNDIRKNSREVPANYSQYIPM